MKKPINEVSRQILDIVEKSGGISLYDLEQTLDVSYNLIFLAIDNMVANKQVNLKRHGREYFLSGVTMVEKLPVNDNCINEYLCQDM
ncbi:MAG TPA: hypothetical protein VJ024_07880 [Thermodesulfovibrionales bacterium]|nr:hypothetical protein [Thermodesulfovibrionales bacterium]